MSASPAEQLRRIAAHPMLTSSTALIALRATSLIARLAILFAIAHGVPPAMFGLLVFALSAAEIGKVASDFGLDTLAIREYAAERPATEQRRFAAALAAGKVVFGLLVYAALAAWFIWKGPAAQTALGVIVGITAMTALLIGYALDWFQARLRIDRVFLPVAALNMVFAMVAVLLVPRLNDLRLQAALLPTLELLGGLVLLWRLRSDWGTLPGFRFDAVLPLAAQSLPIAVTSLLIVFYSRLDVLVLAGRLDAEAVGHYGVAFRLTEPVQIAAAAFGLSVLSRFAGWFRDPALPSLRASTRRYVLATFGYGLVAAAALELVAPPILRAWFPEYAPAIPVLRLLAAALVFRCVNATLAAILQAAGRFRLLTGLALWNLAAVFATLTLLVDRFQASGAALALLVVEALNTVVQLTLVHRTLTAHERTATRGA